MTILIFFILSPISFFVATLLKDESHTLTGRIIIYLILFCILVICYLRYNKHRDKILSKYCRIKIRHNLLSNIFLVIILLAGMGFCFLSMIWVSKLANTYHLDGYLYNHILKWYKYKVVTAVGAVTLLPVSSTVAATIVVATTLYTIGDAITGDVTGKTIGDHVDEYYGY